MEFDLSVITRAKLLEADSWWLHTGWKLFSTPLSFHDDLGNLSHPLHYRLGIVTKLCKA